MAQPESLFKTSITGAPASYTTSDGDVLLNAALNVQDASASIAAAAVSTIYIVTVASSNLTAAMPAPSQGAWVCFKRADAAGSGSFTINPHAAETIDGAATKTLAAGGTHGCILVSDGTNWFSVTTA